jgi:hypothetical protein
MAPQWAADGLASPREARARVRVMGSPRERSHGVGEWAAIGAGGAPTMHAATPLAGHDAREACVPVAALGAAEGSEGLG